MYSSQGTINYPTLLHPVGHFCVLYLDARNHEYQVIYFTTLLVYSVISYENINLESMEKMLFTP
jgi:hypothetical protein